MTCMPQSRTLTQPKMTFSHPKSCEAEVRSETLQEKLLTDGTPGGMHACDPIIVRPNSARDCPDPQAVCFRGFMQTETNASHGRAFEISER